MYRIMKKGREMANSSGKAPGSSGRRRGVPRKRRRVRPCRSPASNLRSVNRPRRNGHTAVAAHPCGARCSRLLIVFAPTILSLGPAASIARAQLRRQWPGTVQVGGVTLSWWAPARVREVVLGDDRGTPIISVRSISARPRLFSLAGRHADSARSGWRRGGHGRPGPDGPLRRTWRGMQRAGRVLQRLPAGRPTSPSTSPRRRHAQPPRAGHAKPLKAVVHSLTAKVDSLWQPIAVKLEGEAARGDLTGDVT